MNEKLIEEARATMRRQEWAPAGLLIRLADALEAAENALTPTDDERAQAGPDSERLRQIAEWLGMEHGHDETAKRVALIADRHDRLAAGFRRSEVPEPSAEQPKHLCAAHPFGCPEDVRTVLAALRAANEVRS